MARSNAGLMDDQVVLVPEAIEELIKWYCRESGVRNLQKHIEKVVTSNSDQFYSSFFRFFVKQLSG